MFDSLDTWQYAAAFAAAALIGLSKTGVAGVGILMVPLLAYAFPARASTGILLPMLVAGDLIAMAAYRRQAQWIHVRRCLPWAAAGVIAGWAFYKWIDPGDSPVRRLIGLVVLAMLVIGWQVSRRRAAAQAAAVDDSRNEEATGAAGPAPAWFAALIGLAGGFTTMVANAAGPVWIVYMLSLGLPKRAFLGTTAWAFFLINLFKVPFSWELGLIHGGSLGLNLEMLPALLAGAGVGLLVLRKLPQKWFTRIATALAVLAALHLTLG